MISRVCSDCERNNCRLPLDFIKCEKEQNLDNLIQHNVFRFYFDTSAEIRAITNVNKKSWDFGAKAYQLKLLNMCSDDDM